MRALSHILVFLLGVLVTLLATSFLRHREPDGLQTLELPVYLGFLADLAALIRRQSHSASLPNFELPVYLDFLAVILTSVTAILAALAIGIGIVAAYTFRELKQEARESAAKTARKVASETAQKLADEALSEKVIWRRLLDITRGGQEPPWEKELKPDYDPSNEGER